LPAVRPTLGILGTGRRMVDVALRQSPTSNRSATARHGLRLHALAVVGLATCAPPPPPHPRPLIERIESRKSSRTAFSSASTIRCIPSLIRQRPELLLAPGGTRRPAAAHGPRSLTRPMLNFRPQYSRAGRHQRWVFKLRRPGDLLLVLFIAIARRDCARSPRRPSPPPLYAPLRSPRPKPTPPDPIPPGPAHLEQHGLNPTLEPRGLVVSLLRPSYSPLERTR